MRNRPPEVSGGASGWRPAAARANRVASGPIGQLTKSKQNVPMNNVCERRRSFTRLLDSHADGFNSNQARIRLEEPKASPDALLLGQLIR
jgi:hypothetical protein